MWGQVRVGTGVSPVQARVGTAAPGRPAWRSPAMVLRQTPNRSSKENSAFTLRKTAASFVFKQPAYGRIAN